MAWVKQKTLFPVIDKFVIKRLIPEAVETLYGDFYESINTIWFDVVEDRNVPYPRAGDWHSFSIDFTFACVGLYDSGEPPESGWPYDVRADSFGFVFVYYGLQSDESYNWPYPGTGWRYIEPWRFVDGVIVTKSAPPKYEGANYGFNPDVSVTTVAPEKQIYHLHVSGSWLEGYRNPRPEGWPDRPDLPYVPEAPTDEIVGTTKMLQSSVDYPLLTFWSDGATGMYSRPRNGAAYPAGMTDVLWWVYDYKQVFDGHVVQQLKHPALTATDDSPFRLNYGVKDRKIIANKWKYEPWARYPSL